MSHLYVMQRANGEFLTEMADNSRTLPIWPDFLSLEKYKVFNPELGLYLPRQVDDRTMAKLKALEKQGTKFLLMSSDEHSPDLKDGISVTLNDLKESTRPAA
jgi:hypothetical protein